MRVKFWGVRGSLPAPLNYDGLTAKLFQAVAGAKGVDLANPDAIRAYLASLPFYVGGVIGGNTTCVEVRSGEHTIVVDAGSGLRSLGLSLMARDFALGKGTAHLFFTHAHWDHLMGFPFFKPAYVKGNRIICYAVNHHPLEYLDHLMTGPTFFPINPDVLPATFEYVTLQEGDTVQIGGVRVCNIHLHHPGIAYAYRFDDGDGSFVFASDAEFKTLDDENMRSHLEFFRGADVLAFDSQFTLKDAFTYEDWGHSSAFIGVDIALHSGTKRLITVHHDPNHTDRQIWEVAEAAQAYARLQPDGASLEVTAGYEGLEIFLGEWEALKVSETIEHGAIVLALSGRLTADAGQEIKARLQTLLAESWRRPVAVDLSDLAGAEPEGIAALSDAVTAAGDMPLALVVPPHHGRRLIDLTVQNDRFAIYQDRQSALGAIVGPAHLRLAGRLISGRYQLGDLATSDDRATLYEARDIQMNRAVLVQVLSPALTEVARGMYLDSVRAWSRLRDPALIQVLDILLEEDGLTMLVLEAPPPQTLKDYCRQAEVDGRLPVSLVASITSQLLQTLIYLHGQGVTHGDLRPEALFWNGQVKISRVALILTRGSNAVWLGPGAYRAPEQLMGRAADERTDLYAVGLILYQLLAGVHPYESESGEVAAVKQMQSEPYRLSALNPNVPPGVESIVAKLLARDPAARFASAEEVRRALLAEVGE